MLAGRVPPEAGISYDVLVDGESYTPAAMIDSQWPPGSFVPIGDREEGTIFPLQYLQEVARQSPEEPLQVAKYKKGVFEAANALRLPLMICVKGHPITYPNGVVEPDWIFQESESLNWAAV